MVATIVDVGGKVPKLARALDKLPVRLSKKIWRKALRKGAKIAHRYQKPRIPVGDGFDAGRLQKSLKVRAIRRSRKAIGVMSTTGTKSNLFSGEAYYGGMVEYGHRVGKRGLPSRALVPGQYFLTTSAARVKRRAKTVVVADLKREVALNLRKDIK